MKHFLLISFLFAAALLFCGCASSEPQAEAPEQKDPVMEKAKEDWKKFIAAQKEEDRNRHDLNTLNNDRERVFPWREGRRSEGIHDRRDSSVFSLW